MAGYIMFYLSLYSPFFINNSTSPLINNRNNEHSRAACCSNNFEAFAIKTGVAELILKLERFR